jgi:hypothetical protein
MIGEGSEDSHAHEMTRCTRYVKEIDVLFSRKALTMCFKAAKNSL